MGGQPGPSVGARTRTRAEVNVGPQHPCEINWAKTQRSTLKNVHATQNNRTHVLSVRTNAILSGLWFFSCCCHVLSCFSSFCLHSNVVRLPGGRAVSASSHLNVINVCLCRTHGPHPVRWNRALGDTVLSYVAVGWESVPLCFRFKVCWRDTDVTARRSQSWVDRHQGQRSRSCGN